MNLLTPGRLQEISGYFNPEPMKAQVFNMKTVGEELLGHIDALNKEITRKDKQALIAIVDLANMARERLSMPDGSTFPSPQAQKARDCLKRMQELKE